MRKWFLAILFVIIFVSEASASLETKISEDCGNYEPIISLSDPNSVTSHASVPNFYEKNICLKGIKEANISTSCEKNSGFYLSSKDENAHFSKFSGYNYHVCTGQVKIPVKDSCDQNETILFSVSSRNDGHVSGPSVFDLKACASFVQPKNISIEIRTNNEPSKSYYFDNTEVSGNQIIYPPASLPYWVVESKSFVIGIVTENFLNAEKNQEMISITTAVENSGFTLPLTEGSRKDIEDRKNLIQEKEFYSSISTNFGFSLSEKPVIRVLLQRNDLRSDIDFSKGDYSIKLEKTGETEVTIK